MQSPIFVVGTARSGTTLLCKMLTAHPNFYLINELPGTSSIFSEEKTREQIIHAIDSELENVEGAKLEDFLGKIGKKKWGLKDPKLTYSLKCIEKWFPDSKTIIIIRDGRAVANSNMKNKWGVATNAYYAAELWKKEITIQKKFYRDNRQNCHVVLYENLVENPEKELRNICGFLEEEYSENMLFYYKEPGYVAMSKLTENTFKELDKNIVDKWKNNLTRYQIDIFESVAGDVLLEHGYTLFGKKRKILKILRWFFYIHQRALGEIQLQYRLRSKGLRKVLYRLFSREKHGKPFPGR